MHIYDDGISILELIRNDFVIFRVVKSWPGSLRLSLLPLSWMCLKKSEGAKYEHKSMMMTVMADFQVEIDTARGVVDTSSGISRYYIQALNHVSVTNFVQSIMNLREGSPYKNG